MTPPRKIFMMICFFVMFTGLYGAWALAQSPGATINPGPDMQTARIGHHSATLPDGKVVVFGGHGAGFTPLSSAEVWNDTAFTQVQMNYTHDGGAFAKLADGRYLIAGGSSSSSGVGYTATAEIYNPANNSFTATGNMQFPRTNNIGATLTSGKVLIVGTWYNTSGANTGELFDPSTGGGVFTSTGPLTTTRACPVVLPTDDGKAVVFGGVGIYGETNHERVELYDPTLNTFSTLQENLFPADPGWTVSGCEIGRSMETQKLSDGRYLFRVSKNTAVALITFDPSTKLFQKLITTPALPDTSVANLSQPIVDAMNGKAYFLGVLPPNTTPLNYKFYSVDLGNMQLTTPPGVWTPPNAINGMLSGFSVTLICEGRLFFTGGSTANNSSFNFNPHAKTFFFSPDAIEPPRLEIVLNKTVLVDQDTLISTSFKLKNLSSNTAAVEIKVWLSIPGIGLISIFNLGADGSLLFPPGLVAELGPLTLWTIVPGWPRGEYEFSSRILHPINGKLLSEDLNSFIVQ